MHRPFRFPAPARCWLPAAWLAIFAVAGCASAPTVQPEALAPSKVVASPAPAEAARTVDEAGRGQQFARWVAGFSASARVAGIDEATLQLAFDSVRFDPRVIASDRAQPEFTRKVGDYLDSALSAQRIARGQDKLLQLRPVVDTMAARYGVPAEVLVAIWGMESN